MSTVPVNSVQSAISFKNKKPVWDFTEVAAYPVEFQQKDKTGKTASIPVYVFLSPYTSDELKDILKKDVSGYKREKRDVEIVARDSSIYTPLCDMHFVKLGNATGTPEQQRAWLDKYPEFKPSIIEHTFAGLKIDSPTESAEDTTTVFDIGIELSEAVNVYQELYDPATDKIVRVDMSHIHSHPTESQYRDYKNARRNRFLRKTNLWTIAESHNALEKLYDTVIQSIDNGSVVGDPCDAKTKANWLPFVPLWHKLWIVDQIFGEIIEKNA